jgi:hypothetical protein
VCLLKVELQLDERQGFPSLWGVKNSVRAWRMRICRRNASFETPDGGRPSPRHLLPREEAQRLCPQQFHRRGTSFHGSTLARIEREPFTGPVLALRPLAGEVAGSGRRGRAERRHGARSPLLERVQSPRASASIGSQVVSRAEPQTWPASLEVASFTSGDPIVRRATRQLHLVCPFGAAPSPRSLRALRAPAPGDGGRSRAPCGLPAKRFLARSS